MKEIVEALHEAVSDEGRLYVGDNSVEVDSSRFVPIPMSSGNAVYVDGGQAEIAGGANFSLQFIRVAAVGYDSDSVRVSQKKFEYYALITVEERDGKIVYITKVFGSSIQIPEIRSDDTSLRTGKRNVEIGQVANVVRKIMELEVMKNIAPTLGNGAVIIRDGDLQQQCSIEKEWWDALKRFTVLGVCKTGSAVTGTGGSANSVLLSKGPVEPWYYFHSNVDGVNVGFVKLHRASKYAFRVDSFQDGYLGTLVMNSADPIFYGYPYGLVFADMFARVSNKEKEFLKIKFMHASKEKYKEFEVHMRSLDAHSILDSIG